MKYLGIDYGEKNIGLAISDSAGVVAMPLVILKNDSFFDDEFLKIVTEQGVGVFVLGESLDYEGNENKINEKIKEFKLKLEKKFGLDVFLVNEVMSSMESKWGINKDIRRAKRKSRKKQKNNRIDDKAATIILKTFLNKAG